MGFRISLFCCLFLFWGSNQCGAQHLLPEFNPSEYSELLKLAERMGDTPWTKVKSNPPRDMELVYRGAVAGLENRWDLWKRKDNVGIIVIRGTNGTATSWLENFYAGMIPAQGTVKLNDSTSVPYKVAEDPRAYVHAGWMLAVAAMGPEIIRTINEYYQQGIHEYIIFGHSQGGAICFLLRSWLAYETALPKDIVFKTYASAAPKPGNLYYAYDFDFISRGGWGLRVVNARDWVPETPFSLQTSRDFNTLSPFTNIKGAFKEQKWPLRGALKYIYGRLDRPSKRASRRMQRILGNLAYKRVKKILPEYKRPDFVTSHNYTPAGTPVILYPVKGYDQLFPSTSKNVFLHHMLEPYRWELEQIYHIDTN
ncbi:lipase family protein [Chitinophaga arvensicola]|uniref:Lipase (Class 3) n=1 Tax=Chitinophaga arvensicola TaxID=29529 RepID=A0A1I0RCH2_9BACT|nr:lipase family protein [Chitinophaga arvensicola]SEW38552.1 Lipase (class 3) [Chitinophaga arvensicola]